MHDKTKLVSTAFLFLLMAVMLAPAMAQVSPQTPDTRTTLATDDFASGMHLYRQGRYQEAISAFQLATQADPANAAAWYFLGYAQYVTHNTAAALDSFSRAFQADPGFDPRPYFYGHKS